MAKKENRISVNAFERVVKSYEQAGVEWSPDIVATWNDLNVTIHRVLPLKDMMAFVERVARSCFDVDSGEYLPQAKDFAIRSNILDSYANFTMPKDLDLQYRFIYATDAVDFVLEHIDRRQFNEIVRSIDAKIEYNIRRNVEAMEKRVDDAVNAVMNFLRQFGGLMDGVTKEDVSNVVNAVSNDSLDEEKLVKAIFAEKGIDQKDDAEGTPDNVVHIKETAVV